MFILNKFKSKLLMLFIPFILLPELILCLCISHLFTLIWFFLGKLQYIKLVAIISG